MSLNDWDNNQNDKTLIMLKRILNLEGADALTRSEQKSINGGKQYCDSTLPCPVGYCCVGHVCNRCIVLEP